MFFSLTLFEFPASIFYGVYSLEEWHTSLQASFPFSSLGHTLALHMTLSFLQHSLNDADFGTVLDFREVFAPYFFSFNEIVNFFFSLLLIFYFRDFRVFNYWGSINK